MPIRQEAAPGEVNRVPGRGDLCAPGRGPCILGGDLSPAEGRLRPKRGTLCPARGKLSPGMETLYPREGTCARQKGGCSRGGDTLCHSEAESGDGDPVPCRRDHVLDRGETAPSGGGPSAPQRGDCVTGREPCNLQMVLCTPRRATLAPCPTQGRLCPGESTLCPAEEAPRFQGVDTVTRVKAAAFWWSVPLPRARSPHGAPFAWVTKFLVPRLPGICCFGSHLGH